VFDGLTAPRSIAGERWPALHVVPTIFITELEHQRVNEFDLSSLRTGIMAGWRATARGSKESIAAIRPFRERRTVF
jgi:hypothetical protein